MATKLEYLKKCVQNLSPIENKSWYYYVFTLLILRDEGIEEKNLYDPVIKSDGLYYVDVNEANEKMLVKIDDYKKDQPLFNFSDVIEVDSSWLPSITSKTQTKVGILLVNALCIYPALKNKLPYLNEAISVPLLEKLIYNKLVDDDKVTDDTISVTEMVNCFNRVSFLSNLANIINIAATEKIITKPTGIDEIKKKLFAEYKDKLDDPVKVVELENKLEEVDKAYLKDDPAAAKIINRKSKIARKKTYLMFGSTMDFVENKDNRPILTSLSEGLPTNEEEVAKLNNDLRVGSYSRGKSTEIGGYLAKILQKSFSGIKISSVPCDTNRGIFRTITENNYNFLINRYIKEGNKWSLVESQDKAKSLIGKQIEIRSLMYCKKQEPNTVCYACMSEHYKNSSESAILNITANLSSTILTLYLKLMHGTTTEKCKIKIEDLVT